MATPRSLFPSTSPPVNYLNPQLNCPLDMSAKDPTAPQVFPEVLKELNREILRAQPVDLYQFCANHFAKKLELQRKQLSSLGAFNPPPNPHIRMLLKTES